MTKIEEVAEAIMSGSRGERRRFWAKEDWKDLAYVAIKAMKEPSKEMIIAGKRMESQDSDDAPLVSIYQAMINAALEERKEDAPRTL